MSITKGVFLSFVGLFLAVCLGFVVVYLILNATLLNQSSAREWVDKGARYDTINKTEVAPRILGAIESQAPGQKLIDQPMIERALEAAVPAEFYKELSDTIVAANYKWLQSGSPEVTFSVPLKAKIDAFYAALLPQVQQKISELPKCNNYGADESSVLAADCLPVFTTAEEATAAIKARIQSGLPYSETFTQDQLDIRLDQAPATRNLNSYVSYLWLANLIALPLIALFTIILLWSGRWFGTIVLGASGLMVGIVGFVLIGKIPTLFDQLNRSDSLLGAILNEAKTSVTSTATGLMVLLVVLGIILITLGLIWRHLQRRKHPSRIKLG